MNRVSKKCLDVSGYPGIRNGSNVQVWKCEDPCNPNTDQVINIYLLLYVMTPEALPFENGRKGQSVPVFFLATSRISFLGVHWRK